MYDFEKGDETITLRPENTAPVVRAFVEHALHRSVATGFPERYYYIGPMFRYERPQKGSSREFLQWNVDLLGVDSPEADAEVVAIVASFFREVGLKPEQVIIHINDRQLVNAELTAMGVPLSDHPMIFRLIDRRDKMREAEWEAFAGEAGLDTRTLDNLKSLLADGLFWKKSEALIRFFWPAPATP